MSTVTQPEEEYDEDLNQLSPEAQAKMATLQKILRLHQNAGTQGEAEAAMARAQEIAVRYNIDLAHIKVVDVDPVTKEPFIERSFVYGSKLYRPMDTKYISGLLQEFFSVECFTQQKTSRERLKAGEKHCIDRKLVIFGRQSDVMFASYVYEYLRLIFAKLWRRYKADSGKGMDARRSFYCGVYIGIHQNQDKVRKEVAEAAILELPEAERKQTESNYQLMVINDEKEREKELEKKYKITYRKQKEGNIYDAEARAAGFQAGLTIKINRALGDNQKTALQ